MMEVWMLERIELDGVDNVKDVKELVRAWKGRTNLLPKQPIRRLE